MIAAYIDSLAPVLWQPWPSGCAQQNPRSARGSEEEDEEVEEEEEEEEEEDEDKRRKMRRTGRIIIMLRNTRT